MQQLDQATRLTLIDHRRDLENLGSLMESLSPEAILKRGFSFTTDENGQLVKTVDQVQSGDRLITRVAGGRISSRVE